MSPESGKWVCNAFSCDVQRISGSNRTLLRCRPLRESEDGRLAASIGGKLSYVGLDSRGQLALLGGRGPSALEKVRPPKVGQEYNLPYVEPPSHVTEEEFSWSVEANTLGVYIFLNCADELVEELVSALALKERLNLIFWGDADKSKFQWMIKLSPSLSEENVIKKVGSFFSRDAYRILARKYALETKNASALSQPSISKDMKEPVPETDEVLTSVSNSLEEMTAYASALEAELRQARTEKTEGTIQRLKKSSYERILEIALMGAFPNLAFAPQTCRTLIEKFASSPRLWEIFRSLDSGHSVTAESLNGAAGNNGWKEVRAHIGTGRDNRGRVYIRPSKKHHSYDVAIHWKKDAREQRRFIERLAHYSPFQSVESVTK